MSELSACSCASIPRLDGAAVKAYRGRFLDREMSPEESGEGRSFRCRACSRVWDEVIEGKQPSLLRRGSPENVKEQE